MNKECQHKGHQFKLLSQGFVWAEDRFIPSILTCTDCRKIFVVNAKGICETNINKE